MMRNGSSQTQPRRRTTIQGNVRVGGRTLVIIAGEEDDNVQVGGGGENPNNYCQGGGRQYKVIMCLGGTLRQ